MKGGGGAGQRTVCLDLDVIGKLEEISTGFFVHGHVLLTHPVALEFELR